MCDKVITDICSRIRNGLKSKYSTPEEKCYAVLYHYLVNKDMERHWRFINSFTYLLKSNMLQDKRIKSCL